MWEEGGGGGGGAGGGGDGWGRMGTSDPNQTKDNTFNAKPPPDTEAIQ